MKIDPQRKLKNRIFYNNLCLLVSVFCIICFITSMFFQNSIKHQKTFYNVKENAIYGPIKISNTKSVYRIIATFTGMDSDTYISGEVLNEDKDTVYEFGKDLWHEQGYDSDGHWSESDRNMTTDLTFSEKGTYYIQFSSDDNAGRTIIPAINLTIETMNGSYVAHLQIGAIFLLIVICIFCFSNTEWVKEKLTELDKMLAGISEG